MEYTLSCGSMTVSWAPLHNSDKIFSFYISVGPFPCLLCHRCLRAPVHCNAFGVLHLPYEEQPHSHAVHGPSWLWHRLPVLFFLHHREVQGQVQEISSGAFGARDGQSPRSPELGGQMQSFAPSVPWELALHHGSPRSHAWT